MLSPILKAPLGGVLTLLATLTPAHGQGWQQTLTGQTTSAHDRFGTSLAHADGQLFVGTPRDDSTGALRGSGSVTVFASSTSGWMETDLLLPPTLIMDGNFGTSLSLDGDRLLIGAPGEDSSAAPATGLVHVHEENAGGWTQVALLEVSDLAPGDRFGYSVALEGDWAVVGATGRDDHGWNSGCVIIFRDTPLGWVEDERLFPPTGSGGARFGHSLALLGDTLVVGAPEDSRPEIGSGAAYVFTRDSADNWSMETALTVEGLGEFQRFGVAVAQDASTIAVGAPGSYSPFGDAIGPQSSSAPLPPRGMVWTFQDTGDGWEPSQRLHAPAGDRGDLFGQRMHLAGGLLSISAGGRPTDGIHKGVTFLYERSGWGWFLTQEIADPSQSPGPYFGAVAVHGDGALFVSGVCDAGVGTHSGCVQVFQLDAGSHQFCFGESCPCGNNDTSAGCANSTGGGAELFALGSASLTEDDLVIGVRGLPAGAPTLVFFSNVTSQTFFGDGTLCVGGGSLSRLGRLGRPKRANLDGGTSWGPGLLTTPGIGSSPEQLRLQAIYRDPLGICGAGVNLSNALEFEVIP